MTNFLRQYGLIVIICLGCLGFGIALGEAITKSRLQPKITQAENDLRDATLAFSDAQRSATEQHNKALRKAIERNQELSLFTEQLISAFHEKSDELELVKQQLDRSILDATEKDGRAYTGLGPDGLRLYTSAFGYYPAAGNQSVSETPRDDDAYSDETPAAHDGRTSGITETRERVWRVGTNTGNEVTPNPTVGSQAGPKP